MEWRLMPRKGPSRQWKRFLDEGWNREVLWNMDCNDDVRDRLLAHLNEVKHSSVYWKGHSREFEQTYQCPWAMRDLYQLFNWITRQERDDLSRFRRLIDEIGYLVDQEGRKFTLDYLFPEEIHEEHLESEGWDCEDFAMEVPF